MAVATPYIARNPSIQLVTVVGTSETVTELACHARTVRLTSDTDDVDVDTFCNPGGTAPGTTTWTAEFDGLQSFSTSTSAPGLWDTLYPLFNTQQTFRIRPNGDSPVSGTNPQATFTAWVRPIPFLDSDRGQTTVVTETLNVVGEPVFATTT